MVCGGEENNYYSCNNRARESTVATVSTSFRLRQLMTHFVASDHELFGSRVSYSFGILTYNIYYSSEGISFVSKLVVNHWK